MDKHTSYPIRKNSKFLGVRRWEQAFRVYAAIYSAANPARSAEIWQYVYVINLAASSYQWDDVAQYDYTFRQLMSQNPERSWAKIYNQMWNLSMRNSIQNRSFNKGAENANQNGNWQHFGSRKSKNCWKFNKGRCTDQNCKFPHKCNYCDGRHGINTCYKKDRKNSSSSVHNDKSESSSNAAK